MALSPELKKRLTSRKFWLAVFGLLAATGLGVYGLLTNQPDYVDKAVTLAVSTITGYLVAEGASDVVSAAKTTASTPQARYDDPNDNTTGDTPIVSGGRYASLVAEDDLDADDDEKE